MTVQVLKRRFTVAEYHQMVAAHILTERDRVELIHGEIIEMSPIGKRHAAHTKRLNKLFSQTLGDRVLVSIQDPVELNDYSEPQPDVALLQPRTDFYASGHPQPEDILLLVEIADTTVELDRNFKIPEYANSAIAEVWLIDIEQQCVEVYRQPSPRGYQDVQRISRGQIISLLAFPQVEINVDAILG